MGLPFEAGYGWAPGRAVTPAPLFETPFAKEYGSVRRINLTPIAHIGINFADAVLVCSIWIFSSVILRSVTRNHSGILKSVSGPAPANTPFCSIGHSNFSGKMP
jgi:hypothetical protein